MKKTLTLLAAAAALAGSFAIAPAASASGCAVVKSDYTMTVACPDSAPGTQFQVVSSCPDGLRYSRWENQGNAITMQCQNIRLADIRFR